MAEEINKNQPEELQDEQLDEVNGGDGAYFWYGPDVIK